jgi:hypothetical protein
MRRTEQLRRRGRTASRGTEVLRSHSLFRKAGWFARSAGLQLSLQHVAVGGFLVTASVAKSNSADERYDLFAAAADVEGCALRAETGSLLR